MEVFTQTLEGRLGALALNREIGPNLLKGLMISILIHAMVVSSPLVVGLLGGEKPIPVPGPGIEVPFDLIRLNPQVLVPAIPDLIRPSAPDMPAPGSVPLPVDEPPPLETLTPNQNEIKQKYLEGGLDPLGIGNGGNVTVTDMVVPPVDEIPPPDTFIAVEVMPQALVDINPQPAYPELAKIGRLTGKVWIKLFVDPTGHVKSWQITKVDPADVGFDTEVLKVVPQWRFTPAIQQGKAVGVWVSVPFTFTFKQ